MSMKFFFSAIAAGGLLGIVSVKGYLYYLERQIPIVQMSAVQKRERPIVPRGAVFRGVRIPGAE